MRRILVVAGLLVRRLLARRRMLGLIGFSALPAVVIGLVALFDESLDDPAALYHGTVFGLYLALALPVVALVNATATLGEERRSSTLPYIYVKPLPRISLALAGWLSATTVTVVAAGTGLLISGAVGIAVGVSPRAVVPGLVATAVAAMGYAGAFVPLGLAFRRATLAGLAYVFIWEAIIAAISRTIAPSSLWRTALSAYIDLMEDPAVFGDASEALGSIVPGTGGAFAKVVVVSVVGLAATTWYLRRRDVL